MFSIRKRLTEKSFLVVMVFFFFFLFCSVVNVALRSEHCLVLTQSVRFLTWELYLSVQMKWWWFTPFEMYCIFYLFNLFFLFVFFFDYSLKNGMHHFSGWFWGQANWISYAERISTQLILSQRCSNHWELDSLTYYLLHTILIFPSVVIGYPP